MSDSKKIAVLAEISRKINSMRAIEPLLEELLDLSVETLNAERGAVVLVDSRGGRKVFKTGFGPGEDYSKSVVEEVLRNGKPILKHDIVGDTCFGKAESLILRGIRSILAAPLWVREKLQGVIYLESGKRNLFVEDDLEFLTALSHMAGVAIENAAYIEELEKENRELKARLRTEQLVIVGECPTIRRALHFAELYARSPAPVLITGESGTGKELLARYIYEKGNFKGRFVPVNCGAIPIELLESELFGYKKGAFTGALSDKKGLIEEARDGVLFLDEISELVPQLQVKMLRFLQDGEIRRVGDTNVMKVRTKVIAATNRDLEELVKEGKFRQDLYFRISVLKIALPPLRERKNDIPALANYFVRKFSRLENKEISGIDREALRILKMYDWPGNVRELENVIHRAVIVSEGPILRAEDFDIPVGDRHQDRELKTLEEVEKRYILEVLDRCGWNKTKAAEILGITTRGLHYKLKRWGLS